MNQTPDYIREFREKFSSADTYANVVKAPHNKDDIESFITANIEEAEQRGRTLGSLKAAAEFKALIAVCSDMYGRGGCGAIYDTLNEGIARLESARTIKP